MPTLDPSQPPADPISIADAVRRAGVSAYVIRIWEQRYGWPKPARLPNGYRSYTEQQVLDLEIVAIRVKDGQPIKAALRALGFIP